MTDIKETEIVLLTDLILKSTSLNTLALPFQKQSMQLNRPKELCIVYIDRLEN